MSGDALVPAELLSLTQAPVRMPPEPDQSATHRLTCKEVSVVLSQVQDRAIGLVERLQLEAHLKLCEGCRNFQRQLDFLRRALGRHPAIRGDGDDQ